MTYASRPERKGYRLTEEGENLYAEWLDLGSCICFTGCAPCHVCTNEGHPISLEETDEVWEPDTKFKIGDEIECTSMNLGRIGLGEKFLVVHSRAELSAPSFHPELVYIEVDGMVRSYSPKHFELVKEETRTYKEILEDVFSKYDKHKSFAQQISETEGGNDVSRSDVVNVKEGVVPSGYIWTDSLNSYGQYIKYGWTNEQLIASNILQPETKKEFKVGYWYKCNQTTGDIEFGEYYKVIGVCSKGSWVAVEKTSSRSITTPAMRFDVNSESSFNPTELSKANNTCMGIERESKVESKVESVNVERGKKIEVRVQGYIVPTTVDLTINVIKQTEEKQTMSNANRRVVNVKLLDNDSGLPVEYALVAQFQGIVTEDSDEVVKQEILLNKNIADAIAKHNEKRMAETDLEILKRTGNDVKLRQVKLKDLTWIVSAA